MSKGKVTDINKNAQKKANQARKGDIASKSAQLKEVQFSLLNMRQMYEQAIQEKAGLQGAITELRTIIGGIMVATDNIELSVTPDHLQTLNALWAGYNMDVNDDGVLEIIMLAEDGNDGEPA